MPKLLVARIMDKLSTQQVSELSCHIAERELKETILLMTGRYDASAIMGFIDAWAKAGGFPIRHHIEQDDEDNNNNNNNNQAGRSRTAMKKHSVVIQHDMGERWSIYFVELFKSAFEQVDTKTCFQHTAQSIVFEVEI